MRIGVGLPNNDTLSDHVLSNFSKDENEILNGVLKLSRELLTEYIKKDFDEMLNYYSKIKVSYSKKIEELRVNSPQEEKW